MSSFIRKITDYFGFTGTNHFQKMSLDNDTCLPNDWPDPAEPPTPKVIETWNDLVLVHGTIKHLSSFEMVSKMFDTPQAFVDFMGLFSVDKIPSALLRGGKYFSSNAITENIITRAVDKHNYEVLAKVVGIEYPIIDIIKSINNKTGWATTTNVDSAFYAPPKFPNNPPETSEFTFNDKFVIKLSRQSNGGFVIADTVYSNTEQIALKRSIMNFMIDEKKKLAVEQRQAVTDTWESAQK